MNWAILLSSTGTGTECSNDLISINTCEYVSKEKLNDCKLKIYGIIQACTVSPPSACTYDSGYCKDDKVNFMHMLASASCRDALHSSEHSMGIWVF
jgi:hypothetical protein